MAKSLIHFPVIYKNGELLNCITPVFIDCSDVTVKGVDKKKAWDAANIKFVYVTGFFFEFEGIEYGSITADETELNRLCCRAAPSDDFSIHVEQFAIQFA